MAPRKAGAASPAPWEAGGPLAESFDRAVAALKAGEIVAFPTDTVYGVGAVAWNGQAVERLYRAKLRDRAKAIPVLLADPADLSLVAGDLPPSALRLAERFWPGPLTLIVPKAAAIPHNVSAGGDTIGVRVPNLPLARALIRAAGAPLATTSANLSGARSARSAQEISSELSASLAVILDGGECPGGVASTVVDASSPEPAIVRAGPITLEEILAIARLDAD